VEKLKAYFVSAAHNPTNNGAPRSQPPSESNNYEGCQPLHIQATTILDPKTSTKRLAVRIRCDSIDLAAELVQDIAKALHVTDLESTADFPEEINKFAEVRDSEQQMSRNRCYLIVIVADTDATGAETSRRLQCHATAAGRRHG
jgi:hypothetical protein